MTALENLLLAIGMSIGLRARWGEESSTWETLDMMTKLLVRAYLQIGGDAEALRKYGVKIDD